MPNGSKTRARNGTSIGRVNPWNAPTNGTTEQDRRDDQGEHADAHEEDEPVACFGLDLTPSRQASHRESGEQRCQAMGNGISRHHGNR